jgi:hypothetical protein
MNTTDVLRIAFGHLDDFGADSNRFAASVLPGAAAIADDRHARSRAEAGGRHETSDPRGSRQAPAADHAPFDFGLLHGDTDEYIITSGAFKGQRGFFSRDASRAVVGVDLAGRLFNRVGVPLTWESLDPIINESQTQRRRTR